MRRLWKWVRRAGIAVFVVAAIVLAVWVAAVPAIVRSVARAKLAGLGLGRVRLAVRGVSLHHIEVADLSAGEGGRFRIGAIGIAYGVPQLARGRLESIEVVGLEVELRRRNGAWDLGPLSGVLASESSGELPFERLALRSSALLLDLEGRRLRIPLQGSVVNRGGGKLDVDFHAGVEGASLHVAGSADTGTGDLDLAIEGEVPEAAALLAAVPPGVIDPALRAWGGATVEATLVREQGELSFDAGIESSEAGLGAAFAGHILAAESLSLMVGLTLGSGLEPKELHLTLNAREAAADGFALAEVSVTARRAGSALALSATAEGDGWTLSKLEGKATGLLEWLRGGPAAVGIELAWAAEADEPWLLLKDTPLKGWIDGERLGAASLSGRATGRLAQKGREAGWEWSLKAPEVVATLKPGDLAIPSAGVALEGLEADFRLAAEASAGRVRLDVLPGAKVAVGLVKAPWLEIAKGSSEPLLAFEIGAKGSVSLGAEEPQWGLTLPEARLRLAEASLTLPNKLGKVDGFAALVSFSASADPSQATAKLLGDSWLAVKSAEVAAGAEAVRIGAVRFALRPDEKAPSAAASFGGGQPASASGALAIEAASPVAVAVGVGTSATLATIRAVLDAAWDRRGTSLAGTLNVGVTDASVKRKLGDGLVAARVPEAALAVRAKSEIPPADDGPASLSCEFTLSTPEKGKGMAASAAGAQVAAGRVAASGTLARKGSRPPAVQARISVEDASAEDKALRLAASGISADLPFAWNAPAPAGGAFKVGSLELRGGTLPGLSGTASLAGDRADFELHWEPLAGAKLRVEGSVAGGPQGPAGRLYVSLPLFKVEDEQAPGRLVPQLKGLLLSGSYAVDGYVRFSPAGLRPSLTVTVLDGTFKSKAWEAEAEGVHATIRISSFEPVLTPRQELQVALVKRAKMGKLEVSDGFLAFRLEPKEAEGRPTGWVAQIQRGEWGWVGGRLYVEGLRFDPAAAEHTVTVHARDLKLGGLLALIPDEEATGVGSLDGKLPVTVGTWPDLRFGNGELHTPAGQTGWFKVKSTEVLGTVLDSQDTRFRTDEFYAEIKKRLIGAFKDFEYDELRVDFIRGEDKFVARVNTKGRARTGTRQEFGGVTLNFPDFDKVLRDAILVSRGVFRK